MITGANGHIGRRLVKFLAGTLQPVALVRSESAREQLAEQLGEGDWDIRVVDYLDTSALAEIATGCTACVHLVGIIKETESNSYTQAHEGTSSALIAALEKSPVERLVYLSIVGSSSESTNSCLASKGRAENLLMKARIPTLVLQVPMVLGEGDFASQAIAQQASKGLSWVVAADNSEQPIYAGDVVSAVMQALTGAETVARRLQLGGPESLSHRELIQRAALISGDSPRVVSLPYRPVLWLVAVLEHLLPSPPMTTSMLEILVQNDEIDNTEALGELSLKLTPLDEMLELCIRDLLDLRSGKH